MALSVDENSFTTQGTILRWYSVSSNSRPSRNNGARTADPAPPYSKALMSCGRILQREKASGNESRDELSSVKNSFL